MAIKDEIYVCDICGEDVGKFNQDTGNHPACEENLALRSRVAELEAYVENARVWFSNFGEHAPIVFGGEAEMCDEATRLLAKKVQ